MTGTWDQRANDNVGSPRVHPPALEQHGRAPQVSPVIPALVASQGVMDLCSLWPERLSPLLSTLGLYLQLKPHPQATWVHGGCKGTSPPLAFNMQDPFQSHRK